MTHAMNKTASGIAILNLRRGKEESLDRFHPWVFSGALTRMPQDGDGVEEGDLVAVAASDGRIVGLGHFQIGSIAVRMLTFDAEECVDGSFFRARLEQAAAMRRALGLPSDNTTAYRLVHGEGDFLPGLVVDIYGATAVVQAHSLPFKFHVTQLFCPQYSCGCSGGYP